MRKEIDKAVETFHRIAFATGKNGRQAISDKQLSSFVAVLTELLVARFRNNWYPESPSRGSGYRCLRMNGQCMDPTIDESLQKSDIVLSKEQRCLELTIWVDPGVVSVRIGEEGSIGAEDVEMETRKDSVSEDEAYVSRSPSPVAAKTPPSRRPADQRMRGRGSPQRMARLGVVYNKNISPPTMPMLKSENRPIRNSPEYMPASYIPGPQQCAPLPPFPAQDKDYMRKVEQMFAARHPHHPHNYAMGMHMITHGMQNMDIPAQA